MEKECFTSDKFFAEKHDFEKIEKFLETFNGLERDLFIEAYTNSLKRLIVEAEKYHEFLHKQCQKKKDEK